ncbi:DUF3667 domain-containing protein [Flavobacterium sp.]|uniref:DUF3667 domain-containing protein n=1 Tax=Flavobacterium sp. TaxID=239 RepID=UPI0039E718BB
MENCKNCTVALQPDYDYCPKCSQKTHLHRLSMHEVVHEGIHYFTHADKGFFQLIRDLVIKGGTIAREYVEGKRKKYFPPLNFFLIVAALNLFAINVDETSDRPDMAREQAMKAYRIQTPEQKEAFLKVYNRQVEAIDFIKHNSNKTVLVMLPIMAFIFWLFYRRQPYNFTEHLIAGMFMYGFCTLVFVVISLVNLIFKWDVNYIYWLTLLLQLFYFSWFYYRFMGNRMRMRAYVASFSAIASVFIFVGLIVMFYMFGAF